jgi:hypothetical protein
MLQSLCPPGFVVQVSPSPRLFSINAYPMISEQHVAECHQLRLCL